MYTVSQINGQSKKSAGNHGNHKRSVPSIPPYHLSLTFMGIENKHFVPVTFTVKFLAMCINLLHKRYNYNHSNTSFNSYKISSKLIINMIKTRRDKFLNKQCAELDAIIFQKFSYSVITKHCCCWLEM